MQALSLDLAPAQMVPAQSVSLVSHLVSSSLSGSFRPSVSVTSE